MHKKGFKMGNKKGLKRGFLQKAVSTPKPCSSSSSSSSTSFDANKLHFISEIKRIFRIRNEYTKAREATRPSDEFDYFDFDFDFLDDREREAFESFHVLMENAGFELLDDPDVIKAIEETDREFFDEEMDAVKGKNLSVRDDKIEKKGYKIDKKDFLKKGFLKNSVFKGKACSSASGEAEKAHFISEMQRLFRIRNECTKLREASRQSDDFDLGLIDAREREAFETFHELAVSAGFGMLGDPDVIKAIEETERELFDVEIDAVKIGGLSIKDDKIEKKGGLKMEKKGFLEKGFLNNGVLRGTASSSSASSSSSYETKKRNFMTKLQRLLGVRNEYMKKREASKRVSYFGFIDDGESEAFNTFNDLMDSAGSDLLEDPDVIHLIAQKDCELESEIAGMRHKKLTMRTNEEQEFVEGLRVGREVRIVSGSHIGKKGKVLQVNDGNDSVQLRFLNDEEVVVWVGNVAYLGSTAEDMCLMKLMEMKSKGKEAEDVYFQQLRASEIIGRIR